MILVADDDLGLLNTLVKALEIEGFGVLAVSNGKDALDAALKHHPDLIIIDEKMPELSGAEMIEQLRNDEWGMQANIVMLTNIDATNDINTALKLGVSDYLVKSDLHITQIVEIVKNKLK